MKIKRVSLHQHQQTALKSDKRFIGIIAGTGGGKTFFGPIWLSKEIAKYPGDQFFVIAPTYKMLTRATVPMLIGCYRGTTLEGEYKETKGQYILPDGGIIWFGSADRPETLESGQYRAVWIDEAGQMKFQVWIVMQARLGVKMGRCLITTTPYSLNWLKTEFYDRWKGGDPDYDVIQFSSIDNPYYPKPEFERARNTLDTRIFEMRYMGEFRKMAGLVYAEFTQDNIAEPEGIKFKQVVAGVDWGFYPDPAVIILHGEDNQGRVWVFFEYYHLRKTIDEMADDALAIRKKYGVDEFWCDPSEPGYIEVFKRKGLRARASKVKSVNEGIGAVTALIKNKALFVSRKCPNWLDEVETYHIPEGKEKPEGPNHALDATRYAIVNMKKGKRILISVAGEEGD